ncbi:MULTISPECIES: c-type cytochrome [Vitreoscilla]|uniref:Cytochrome c n=1 Tax=Vitreoscilla stercoraria TaxID=61 RepID=A0ABY4EBH0_VITST|nr:MULTISPECIES: cytochrome c [Vitreoscilla]AUZ03997.1 cytochrome C' [Vitreoscilla sp. C1]UOO93097.1 cytochrome c [Vitreoscilla stercoraria]
MTKTLLASLALALCLSACGGEKTAPADKAAAGRLSAEDQVKERVKNMKVLAQANKTLKEVAAGDAAFDAAKVQAAAATLNQAANQGWEHYSITTIDTKSNALPVVWEKNDAFKQEIQKLQDASKALNEAAAQGTLDAVKAPIGQVGESCKSCHTAFKARTS